jgi:UDP-N-acetylmuramyl pentapeptide phosphotransferase/UDP-N-acetylglucosamine-1-phosphate transferase
MIYLSFVFLSIFILTFILINLYIKFSSKVRFFDEPKEINMHYSAIPTGSGIVFVFLYIIFLLCLKILETNYLLEINYPNRFYLFNIFIVCLTLISFIDDIRNVHPNIRFFFQIVIVFLSLPLLNIEAINNYIPLKLSLLLLIIYWVYIINCSNFIDGLDGFLISYSIFFYFNSFFYFYLTDIKNYFYFFSLFILIISTAFLFFNRPPAKTFMGDAGSIFLGYSIGLISLYFLSISRVDISISLICYPVLDCGLTIIKKMLNGKYPWERLFDYNFLKPVKLYNQSHGYVLKYFIIHNILITKNIALQIYFELNYFFLLSIFYSLVLILFYNKDLRIRNDKF